MVKIIKLLKHKNYQKMRNKMDITDYKAKLNEKDEELKKLKNRIK